MISIRVDGPNYIFHDPRTDKAQAHIMLTGGHYQLMNAIQRISQITGEGNVAKDAFAWIRVNGVKGQNVKQDWIRHWRALWTATSNASDNMSTMQQTTDTLDDILKGHPVVLPLFGNDLHWLLHWKELQECFDFDLFPPGAIPEDYDHSEKVNQEEEK